MKIKLVLASRQAQATLDFQLELLLQLAILQLAACVAETLVKKRFSVPTCRWSIQRKPLRQ